jgi:hypothetical protein
MAIDFMNMFAPRGTPSALDALLSDDQRKLMNRNANLSAAAALLQAGGRSRQRVGLGQALGAALQAGQQGYQQARTGSLQELLLGEKLQESKDERQRNLHYLKLLEGTPAPAQPRPRPCPPCQRRSKACRCSHWTDPQRVRPTSPALQVCCSSKQSTKLRHLLQPQQRHPPRPTLLAG